MASLQAILSPRVARQVVTVVRYNVSGMDIRLYSQDSATLEQREETYSCISNDFLSLDAPPPHEVLVCDPVQGLVWCAWFFPAGEVRPCFALKA